MHHYIRLITVLAWLICTVTAGAKDSAPNLGPKELIGTISRLDHAYWLHLQSPIKIAGTAYSELRLVDTKAKKLAELDTMTSAQIGTGRYGILGVIKKDAGGLRCEVIKCKPLVL